MILTFTCTVKLLTTKSKNLPIHIGGSVQCTSPLWESRKHFCILDPLIVYPTAHNTLQVDV